MEMLVTKFSKGKYANESELFAEPISTKNVKLMGEMIALQALRTIKKFDMRIADKLYIGLIKDLHHMNEVGYIVSDGYDVAQTAICFLYQYIGHTVHEIYGRDRKGKEITIKLACYREVNRFIDLLRNRPDRRGTIIESIDFTDYKALPADPVDCFEHEQTDYSKYDELIGALQLSAFLSFVLCPFFVQIFYQRTRICGKTRQKVLREHGDRRLCEEVKNESFRGKNLQRRESLDSDTAHGTPVQAKKTAKEARKERRIAAV